MVLPPSPPHDAPSQGTPGWIRRLKTALGLSSSGLLALVDHAHFERLGELVRELLPLAPELEVYSEAPQCLEAEPGSTLILVPRAEDADWLNINRPLFSVRALRVVLFCTREVSVALLQRAVDFMDWLSLRVECPPGPVSFAVDGLRVALANRVPGIVWTGGDLEANFAAARPHHSLKWVSAARPYEELVAEAKALRPRQWIAWTEINGLFHLRRVRWAMAEAKRRTRAFMVEPGLPSPGWWEVHGRIMDFGEARACLFETGARQPGRQAALLNLEPESVSLLRQCMKLGVPIPVALMDEELRADLDPGVVVGRWVQAKGLISEQDLTLGRASTLIMRTVGSNTHKMRSLRHAELMRLDQQLNHQESIDQWWLAWWAAWTRGAPSPEQYAKITDRAEMAEVSIRCYPQAGEAYTVDAFAALSAGDLEVAATWATRAFRMDPSTWGMLFSVLFSQGKFPEAESLLLSRKDGLASALEHVQFHNRLGTILYHQGRYPGAEEALRQALEAYSKLAEPDGLTTMEVLSAMSNLAETLRARGKLDEAREQTERVLKARLQFQGEEHPNTLQTMENLARILSLQGKLEDSRKKYEQVLDIYHRLLGENNLETLRVRSNLASILSALGRLDEAIEQDERAWTGHRQLLGDEHPDTLSALTNFVAALIAQGKWIEASEQQERLLDASLRVLGKEHPNTLAALNNSVLISRGKGQLKEAQEQQERALEASIRVLGEEHSITLTALNNLAGLYMAQGEFSQALAIENKVLERQRRMLGNGHPFTLLAMENLSMMFRRVGDVSSAETLEKEIEEIRQRQK